MTSDKYVFSGVFMKDWSSNIKTQKLLAELKDTESILMWVAFCAPYICVPTEELMLITSSSH